MSTDDEPLPRLIATYSGEGHTSFEFLALNQCRVSLKRSIVLGWQQYDNRCLLYTLVGNIIADHSYDEINEVLQ